MDKALRAHDARSNEQYMKWLGEVGCPQTSFP